MFARKGYRAHSHVAGGATPAATKLPALALLDRTPLPNAFPGACRRLQLPRSRAARPDAGARARRHRVAALQRRPRSAPPTPGRPPSSCASATARAREVQKLSQQYLLTGEAKDLEAAKRGEILFYREPDLPPGVYTMETIVFDATARQGSARVATLTVPAGRRRRSAMSSLVLVSRIEEMADAATGRRRSCRRSTSGTRCSIRISASRSGSRRPASCRSISRSTATSQGVDSVGAAAAERPGRSPKHPSQLPPAHGLARAARRPAADRRASGRHLRVAHPGHRAGRELSGRLTSRCRTESARPTVRRVLLRR